MKKAFLLLVTLVFGFSTFAQKVQKDSATNYINLWIKQNTERAITGTIMNAALNKMQRGIIDTAYYSGDSLYIVQNGAARFLRRDGWKKTGNYISNTNASNVGINTTSPDSTLTIWGGLFGTGGVRFTGLPSAAGTKALRYDPGTGNISYADTSAGGGSTPTLQQVFSAQSNNAVITSAPVDISPESEGVAFTLGANTDWGLFSVKADSVNFPLVPNYSTSDTTYTKPVSISHTGKLFKMNYWPSQGLPLTGGTLTGNLIAPTIYGSASSGGNITIGSTSNATKGNIYFGGSTAMLYDQANQTLKGYSTAGQLRFQLGYTLSGFSGISTRDGQVVFGFIDATANSGLRTLVLGSGKTYIDGYSEGSSQAQNYGIYIGSRVNNTGSSITNSSTAETGSQVVFGRDVTPSASALVTIESTTRGFLPPRMTSAQATAIASKATGLTMYCTDCTATDGSTGVMITWNGSVFKNNW